MKKKEILLNESEEIIRYLIVGSLTTVINLTIYYFLVYTLFNPNVLLELQITNIISWVISVTFAYFTNRIYVFRKKNNVSSKEILCFYLSRIFVLILEILLMYIFVNLLKYNDKIVKLTVQIVIIIFNYLLSKFIVFKSKGGI